MKITSKILSAVLVVAMLLTLCACGGNSDSTTANYQVKVLDGQGNPFTSGIIVKFMKDGQQIAMQPVNGEGIASKELDKGDYTVELTFTDSSINGHYDTSAAVLSADKTYLELSLISALGNESVDLVVNNEDHKAYVVNAGSTYLTVKASVRNYFLFTPAEAGTYELRVDNNDVKVGYYGAPHYVQSISAIDAINNVITLSISAGSIGGSYVFGLDGLTEDTSVVMGIIRTGDPSITISDMPWTEYKTTHTPSEFTLSIPSGKSLKYVDVTGKTEDTVVVKSDADGYYHYGSANGPIVYVHLGKGAPYFALQTVIEGDGLGGGAPIREYFYDANGEFLKKEDYTDILRTYFENMDANHYVYPLNDDLIYIIKNGCKQWWDKNDPDYNEQFSITDCNPEIGWMFALCYIG